MLRPEQTKPVQESQRQTIDQETSKAYVRGREGRANITVKRVGSSAHSRRTQQPGRPLTTPETQLTFGHLDGPGQDLTPGSPVLPHTDNSVMIPSCHQALMVNLSELYPLLINGTVSLDIASRDLGRQL